jgi:uncharacterized protein Smg (DUF494 family)
MQERIVEIILFLVNELRSKKRLSDVDVSSLTRDGYTQSEISSAFTWLFERISLGKSMIASVGSGGTSHRMLNETEKMVIDSYANGFLIQCQQLGLLTSVDMETIIERIMMAGFSTVGLPEMKSFVAGFLFDREGGNGQVSLGINDTIH